MNKGVLSLIPARLRYPQTTYGAFGSRFTHLQDMKAANTDGGTFTSGAWRTRTLNTTHTNEIGGAQIVSDQITLLPGVYQIVARAPAYNVGSHQCRFRNITLGETTIVGSNAVASSTDVLSDSTVNGRFSIDRLCKFELQHRCAATRATDGFGTKTNFGELEVYAEVMLWKIR